MLTRLQNRSSETTALLQESTSEVNNRLEITRAITFHRNGFDGMMSTANEAFRRTRGWRRDRYGLAYQHILASPNLTATVCDIEIQKSMKHFTGQKQRHASLA